MIKIKRRTLTFKRVYMHICALLFFAILTLLIIQGSFYQLTRTKELNIFSSFFLWAKESPMMFWENFLIIVSYMFCFYFLTTNLGLAVLLPSAIIITLGFVNYVKYTLRTSPLYPDELSLVKNIGSMINLVDTKVVVVFFLIIFVLLFVIGLLFKLSYFYTMSIEYRLLGTVLFFFLSVSSLFFTVEFSSIQKLIIIFSVLSIGFLSFQMFRSKQIIKSKSLVIISFVVLAFLCLVTFNHKNFYSVYNLEYSSFPYAHYMGDDYMYDGVIHSFLNRITLNALRMPDGYSEEKIQEIVSIYNEIARQENEKLKVTEKFYKNTNIVFLMSEAFSDPTVFPEFQFSQDPMPYTRQLMEEFTSTDVIVCGYGGATVFAEVDALTSYEMNMVGYNSFATLTQQIPTFVNFLSNSGYRTVAVHPNEATFYRRDKIYPSLGFQEFIDLPKMNYTEKLSDLNNNTSDASIFHELMDLLKETEEPLFAHLVTIQNHGPYPRDLYTAYKESLVTVTSDIYNYEAVLDSLSAYATGLKISDQELELLIEQIEQLNEPTILVFWGDHLPVGYPEELFEDHAYEKEKYATPFFIYSNFSSLKNNLETSIGTNDILWVVKDQFSLPKNGMESMVKELSYLRKGHADSWYIDKNNVLKYYDDSRSTEQDYIDLKALEYNYYLIEYDILKGKRYSEKMAFWNNTEDFYE